MTTAIIGTGNIGSAIARHLTAGGEQIVLAARNEADAATLAGKLGSLASEATVKEAIEAADAVIFSVWLDVIKQLIPKYTSLLDGKVVADPSNPIGFGQGGEILRTLPDDTSAGEVIASMLPAGAHYVKAFGALSADSLAHSANRSPRHVVLFYATDDNQAATVIERLITICGFEPVRAGGVNDAGRIEVPGGDLHQNGGLGGRLLDLDQARATIGGA